MEKSPLPTGFIGHADSSKCRRRCHGISDTAAKTSRASIMKVKKNLDINFYYHLFIFCLRFCLAYS